MVDLCTSCCALEWLSYLIRSEALVQVYSTQTTTQPVNLTTVSQVSANIWPPARKMLVVFQKVCSGAVIILNLLCVFLEMVSARDNVCGIFFSSG